MLHDLFDLPFDEIAAIIERSPAATRQLASRAAGAVPVLIRGLPGLAWAPGGKVRVAFVFHFTGDAISGIELIADPARLERLKIATSPSGKE